MAAFAVILPAAGKSTRFRHQQRKKPFAELKRRPVWVRTAEHFVNREDVCQTLVVVSADDLDWFKDKFRANLAFMDIQIVTGGAERADSVQRALDEVNDAAEYVAVHDAARPLLTKQWIDAVFAAAERTGAAIPGVRVTNTLKRGDNTAEGVRIAETVPREDLWYAQTPQVFRKDLLTAAYEQREDFVPTDEASLVERLGYPIEIVEGSPLNIKITTRDDFKMAEQLLDVLPKEDKFRDLHPFRDENGGLFD